MCFLLTLITFFIAEFLYSSQAPGHWLPGSDTLFITRSKATSDTSILEFLLYFHCFPCPSFLKKKEFFLLAEVTVMCVGVFFFPSPVSFSIFFSSVFPTIICNFSLSQSAGLLSTNIMFRHSTLPQRFIQLIKSIFFSLKF